MNGKVTRRDYETLSAYLDGVLKTKDRTRLEKRLQSDQLLKQELEALKRTRMVLRSQPRLRAPRNFTLTAQMAGVRSPVRSSMSAVPALRLVSVLATVFLVLVIVGDLIGSSKPPQTIVASDLPQPAAASMPGFGMGGGGGASSEPAVASADSMEGSEEQPAAAAAMKAMPEPNSYGTDATLETEPSIAAEENSDEAALSANGGTQNGGIGVVDETSIQTKAPHQTVWPLIRVIQALLALIAAGTGLLALILWRKSTR